MWPIIPIVLALARAAGGILSVAEIALIELFSNKKTLFTGPLSSGKTTFLRYIAKEKIKKGPSGAPKRYKVKNAMFDEVTDFSGAEAWLKSKFNDYIKEHDYILFFFDISEYIKDIKYRADSNARIDMIHRNSTSSQKVLIVGTHVDKLHGNYQAEIGKFFAGKPYQSVLNRVVYIDTTKKECVETVLNELKK